MTAAEMTVMEEVQDFDLRRLAEQIAKGRKDEVVIDFARLISAHYGKMVETFSAMQGQKVFAHNNKTLFLEGADIWCRKIFAKGQDRYGMGLRRNGRETSKPREVIEFYLTPWYEALKLEDPSQYRMRNMGPAPVYVGADEDATCTMLAVCASVDIGPIFLAYGLEDKKPVRVWGKVNADQNVYHTDINDPSLVLGEHREFDGYDEAEVPL